MAVFSNVLEGRPYWGQGGSGEGTKLVSVSSSALEFKEIAARFLQTLPQATVVQIDRVETAYVVSDLDIYVIKPSVPYTTSTSVLIKQSNTRTNKPRLVVSLSTCPPFSLFPPPAHSFFKVLQ